MPISLPFCTLSSSDLLLLSKPQSRPGTKRVDEFIRGVSALFAVLARSVAASLAVEDVAEQSRGRQDTERRSLSSTPLCWSSFAGTAGCSDRYKDRIWRSSAPF